MSSMTIEQIKASYEFGKQIYSNRIDLKHAKNKLVDLGMNENSAIDYLYLYGRLLKGEVFKRAHNSITTEYYLSRIYQEDGEVALKNALISMSLHLDYFDGEKKNSKRREICKKYNELMLAQDISFPEEIDVKEEYYEGHTKTIKVNVFERNGSARVEFLKEFGYDCYVCGINFEKVYGIIGRDYIHVHHKIDLARIGKQYKVIPEKDLVQVCPNCHSMLHTSKPAMDVEELKKIIKGS